MPSFIAPTSGSGNFKRVPPGSHIGRCYMLVDIGTQRTVGQFGEKDQRKIRIGFEVFGEDEAGEPLVIRDSDKGVDMPMTISKSYTFSMHEKASLRKDLAAWRGKAFTEEETRTFDIAKLVGAYCLLNVTETSTGDKTYSNIAGISPLPKAMNASKPAPVHSNLMFSLAEPDMIVYGALHDKLRETIAASPEWQALQAKKGGKAEQSLKQQPAGASEGSGFETMESDVPFISALAAFDMVPRKLRRMGRHA